MISYVIVTLVCLSVCPRPSVGRAVRNDVDHVTVKIETERMVREVDSRYCSYALGCTLVDKGWMTFDTHSTRLKTLAKALSPAYLRLGGTWADYMYFTPDNDDSRNKAKFKLESFDFKDPKYLRSLDSYGLRDGPTHIDPFNITAEGFSNINQFALDTDMSFLYDMNVLNRKDGKWNPDNAKQILDFSIKKGFYKNQLFELGNEPDSMPWAIGVNLTADELAQDFLDFHDIIQSDDYKKYYGNAKLFGDDTAHYDVKDYLTTFLKKAGKVINGAVTWHHYYLDGSKASADDFLDTKVMDAFEPQIQSMAKTLKEYMPEGTKMWLGETGSAFGGGAPNLSNRYCAGFLLMDKLGVGAKAGIDVVLRNTFYEGQYALIDENLNPSPDFWLSWVFRNLVGTKVLNVTLDSDTRSVRLYAHCTNVERSVYPKGAITIYGMNVYDYDVTFSLGGHLEGQMVHEYLIEHHSGGIVAELVEINGKLMELVDDKTLPMIEPRVVSGSDKVILPQRSYAFYVIPNAMASVCIDVADNKL